MLAVWQRPAQKFGLFSWHAILLMVALLAAILMPKAYAQAYGEADNLNVANNNRNENNGPRHRRLSPEERRELRRSVHEANRDIYLQYANSRQDINRRPPAYGRYDERERSGPAYRRREP